jgi:hypothetical protein
MDSTPSLAQADQRKVLIAQADEELAHAHELIAGADEQIARVNKQLSNLKHNAATTFRRGARGRRLSRGRSILRYLASFLLAVFICVAAIAWHSPYGDVARSIVARSAQHFAAAVSPAQNKPAPVKSAASHEMYLELTRQADSFVGQPLSFAGKVIQSIQSGQRYVLQINVTPGNYNSWQDTIYVDYEAPALTVQDRIVEGDFVSVRGTFASIRSYQSVLGEMRAPSVVACVIQPGLANIPACPGETATIPANPAN